MNRYLITRHGSNAANQSMCQRLDICIVEAGSAAEAVAKAAEDVHCYVNQYLTAKHVNSVPARVRACEDAAAANSDDIW